MIRFYPWPDRISELFIFAEFRQVGLPAAMPFELPGDASVPLTQVFDRFISLFQPSTMSVVGSMNRSRVSVIVSREIGLAKMFECEM